MRNTKSTSFCLLVVQLLLVLLLSGPVVVVIVASTTAGGEASSTSSSYESVRSLDKYGNAVQLQYARAAADKQGRLIVAVVREGNNDSVWIVSETPQIRPHHYRRCRPKSCTTAASGLLVQAVTSPEPATVIRESTMTSPAVYMVCTGIQADAAWLLQQMQMYGKHVAERYGTHAPTAISASVVSALKRKFWNYGGGSDSSSVWQGSAYSRMAQGDDSSWARPLGVRTLVISFPTTGRQRPVVVLELVEPSGIVQRGNLFCIGKYSDICQNKLLTSTKKAKISTTTIDDADLEALLLEAFASALDHNKNEPPSLLLEIVSARGIERRTLCKKE